VRKLSATDSTFLYGETLRTPMHIASVQLMRLPAGMTAEGFVEALRRQVRSRRHLVPYIDSRLSETPWQLDHPSLRQVADVDFVHHIHRRRVLQPGDSAALERTVSSLHETLLDRSRPLWEMVVIDGLADGRVAIYNRIHHACIDGMAGQIATQLLYDTEPLAEDVSTTPSRCITEAANPLVDVINAFEHFRNTTDGFLHALPDTLHALDRVQSRLAGPDAGWIQPRHRSHPLVCVRGTATCGTQAYRCNSACNRQRCRAGDLRWCAASPPAT
jgi:WS/DGAT/MGAT family acyltransferase